MERRRSRAKSGTQDTRRGCSRISRPPAAARSMRATRALLLRRPGRGLAQAWPGGRYRGVGLDRTLEELEPVGVESRGLCARRQRGKLGVGNRIEVLQAVVALAAVAHGGAAPALDDRGDEVRVGALLLLHAGVDHRLALRHQV